MSLEEDGLWCGSSTEAISQAHAINAAAIAQARALENKALRCLDISQAIFPHESDEELESIAAEFMYLSDNGINRILRHLRASNLPLSFTKEPVPVPGIIKMENRYSILRRENAV